MAMNLQNSSNAAQESMYCPIVENAELARRQRCFSLQLSIVVMNWEDFSYELGLLNNIEVFSHLSRPLNTSYWYNSPNLRSFTFVRLGIASVKTYLRHVADIYDE